MSGKTPKIGHGPIKMRNVGKDWPHWSKDWPHWSEADPPRKPDWTRVHPPLKQRGDFYWNTEGGNRVLVLAIPILSGEKKDWSWSRWNITKPNMGGHQWRWDGNEDEPTLRPSLHDVGLWHGYVKGGVLTEA